MIPTNSVEIRLVAFVKKTLKQKTLRYSKSEYSLPLVSFNTWEVIAVDSFVTFRDLLATFIASLYKNHNDSNHKKKKK